MFLVSKLQCLSASFGISKKFLLLNRTSQFKLSKLVSTSLRDPIGQRSCPISSYQASFEIKGSSEFPFEVRNPKNLKGFRSNDNLSDLLSRIRNGYFRSFEEISVIDCKQNRDLLDSFIYAGYIHNWKVMQNSNISCSELKLPKVVPNTSASYLQVNLKYFENIPAIRGLQQISRPGNRTYLNVKQLLKYSTEQNWGENKTIFLSTSEGIFNHREIISGIGSEPKKFHSINSYQTSKNHSGEALCLIW